ncbi:MAG: UbiA family prenyltransferase [Cyclobacteriaceae bacterium]
MRTFPSILFYLAASALILSGAVFNQSYSSEIWIALSVICTIGTYIIYNLNSIMKQTGVLNYQSAQQGIDKYFTGLGVLICISIAIKYLNNFQWVCLFVIAIMGIAYSYKWNPQSKNPFMLKKVFFIKNLIIGIGWGLLVLVGYGNLEMEIVNWVTVFASLQVIVGSIMRDVKDKERDILLGYKTLPVVLGIPQTIWICHLINLTSITPFLLLSPATLSLYLGVIILWRSAILEGVRIKGSNNLFTQKLNLISCVLILIMISLHEFY